MSEDPAEASRGNRIVAIANFYVSITFDSSVSIPDALLYLRRLREASWRQLIALRYFADGNRSQERELIEVALTEGTAYIHAL
jgi:hypothetical protein